MINLLLKDHVSGLKWSVVWILWQQNKFWKRHFGQKWVWSADELWLKVGIPPARSTCVHVTYLLKWTKEIRCRFMAVYRLVFIFSNNLKKIRQDIRVLKDIFDLEGYFFMNEIYSVKIWNKFWWMNYSTSCHESVSCFRSFLYFNDIFRTIEEHMFILCSNIFCD